MAKRKLTPEQAESRFLRLRDRYNREYREGRWSTNRPLAGQVEDAYSEMVRIQGEAGVPRGTAEERALGL